jgi:hypothetical protein
VWCGDSSLKEALPGLYNMASEKNVPIDVNMDYQVAPFSGMIASFA